MAEQHPPQVPIVTFWNNLGAVLARLLSERAHADITITVRDGHIQRTNVNRSYLPGSLPGATKP